MRTTLNIDDDLIAAAKALARHDRSSVGAVVSSLLRQALAGCARPAACGAERCVAGFRPFPAARPDGVASHLQVAMLRDTHGI